MGESFSIRGTASLIRKQTAFRNIDPKLRRHLTKNLNAAVRPLKAAIRASALESLPKGGGLNEVVAASKISVRTTLTRNKAGVRLITSNPHAIKAINSGRLRHPVYGNRKVWVTQAVEPGWWDKPVEEFKPEATAAALKAVEDTIEELKRA